MIPTSLAYILIYFLCKSLPWQGLGHSCIAASKQNTSTLDLCHNLLMEFHVLLECTCSLPFDVRPDYGHLNCLVNDLLLQEGPGLEFDWDSQTGK